jgi:hypothetical protein
MLQSLVTATNKTELSDNMPLANFPPARMAEKQFYLAHKATKEAIQKNKGSNNEPTILGQDIRRSDPDNGRGTTFGFTRKFGFWSNVFGPRRDRLNCLWLGTLFLYSAINCLGLVGRLFISRDVCVSFWK